MFSVSEVEVLDALLRVKTLDSEFKSGQPLRRP